MPKWIGDTPVCDLCHSWEPAQPWFVDGRTKMGPWAVMCPCCFFKFGVGLGPAEGQAYHMQSKEPCRPELVVETYRQMVQACARLVAASGDPEAN